MTTIAPAKRAGLKGFLARPANPYVHPYLGGALLGIVLFMAFLITRNGLGASAMLNRYVAVVEDAVAPRHIDKTPYLLKLAGPER
jgi:hypothetical protein